jgi:nucleotide-binding universal stress UspA family protein
MTKVIACLVDPARERAIVGLAGAVAPLFGAEVEQVRVGGRDALAALVHAGEAADVEVIVIGEGHALAADAGTDDATALATRTDTPVLAIPPDATVPTRIERVLIAMKGTPASELNLKRAIQHADLGGVDVVVLHVDDEASIPPFSDQVQHEVDAYAREFLARWIPGAEHARIEFRVGTPTSEILETVSSTHPDVLAVGWPRSDDAARGHTARELLQNSPVPVLLVATS